MPFSTAYGIRFRGWGIDTSFFPHKNALQREHKVLQ